MECSRDSCHHMRYIDCSSAMILGTSRLLSAPDPPWTGRLDQRNSRRRDFKEFLDDDIYIYIYIRTTHHIFREFFFDPIHGPLSVLCICALETFWNSATDSQPSHFQLSFLEETKKECQSAAMQIHSSFGDVFVATRRVSRVGARFKRRSTNHLLSGHPRKITAFRASRKFLSNEKECEIQKRTAKTQAVTIWCLGEHRKPVFSRHCTASCVSLADLSRLLLAIYSPCFC